MARDKITEYDSTAANNTVCGDVNIAENSALPSDMNNFAREIMSHLKEFADGTSGVDVLNLQDDDASASIKIQAPAAVTTTTTFTLPDGDGADGQALITDGSGTLAWAYPYGNRNLIINGNLSVWQRSTSQTSITSNGYHTADRWNINYGSTGLSHKQEQSSDVPDGFGYSLKVTATTQYSSLGAGDAYELDHRFEGQNLQQIKKGTSNAQPVTLSFWVKSSITGTFICAFNDLDTSGQRMVSGAYTINSANTWEYKTITFPADTTGAFNNDNGLSARIIFCLAAGSNYTSGTLATSWEASSGGANTYVGQTNLFGTLNATWQITGVQLELGSQATPFEHRSYADELHRCSRYLKQYKATTLFNQFAFAHTESTTHHNALFTFDPPMRDTPSAVTVNGSIGIITNWGLGVTGISAVALDAGSKGFTQTRLRCTTSSGVGTAGECNILLSNNNASSTINFDAEL